MQLEPSLVGRLGEALEDYTAAINLNSTYAHIYINRGNVKAKLHFYEEAIEDYSTALTLDSNYTEAYHNRGLAKLKLGKKQEAFEDIEKAFILKGVMWKNCQKSGFQYSSF